MMRVGLKVWGDGREAGKPTTIYEMTFQNPLPADGLRSTNHLMAASESDLDAIHKATSPEARKKAPHKDAQIEKERQEREKQTITKQDVGTVAAVLGA